MKGKGVDEEKGNGTWGWDEEVTNRPHNGEDLNSMNEFLNGVYVIPVDFNYCVPYKLTYMSVSGARNNLQNHIPPEAYFSSESLRSKYEKYKTALKKNDFASIREAGVTFFSLFVGPCRAVASKLDFFVDEEMIKMLINLIHKNPGTKAVNYLYMLSLLTHAPLNHEHFAKDDVFNFLIALMNERFPAHGWMLMETCCYLSHDNELRHRLLENKALDYCVEMFRTCGKTDRELVYYSLIFLRETISKNEYSEEVLKPIISNITHLACQTFCTEVVEDGNRVSALTLLLQIAARRKRLGEIAYRGGALDNVLRAMRDLVSGKENDGGSTLQCLLNISINLIRFFEPKRFDLEKTKVVDTLARIFYKRRDYDIACIQEAVELLLEISKVKGMVVVLNNSKLIKELVIMLQRKTYFDEHADICKVLSMVCEKEDDCMSIYKQKIHLADGVLNALERGDEERSETAVEGLLILLGHFTQVQERFDLDDDLDIVVRLLTFVPRLIKAPFPLMNLFISVLANFAENPECCNEMWRRNCLSLLINIAKRAVDSPGLFEPPPLPEDAKDEKEEEEEEEVEHSFPNTPVGEGINVLPPSVRDSFSVPGSVLMSPMSSLSPVPSDTITTTSLSPVSSELKVGASDVLFGKKLFEKQIGKSEKEKPLMNKTMPTNPRCPRSPLVRSSEAAGGGGGGGGEGGDSMMSKTLIPPQSASVPPPRTTVNNLSSLKCDSLLKNEKKKSPQKKNTRENESTTTSSSLEDFTKPNYYLFVLDLCQLISDVTRAVPELKQDELIEKNASYINTLIRLIRKITEICSECIPNQGEKPCHKFKMGQFCVDLLISSLRYLDAKVEKEDLKKNSDYLQQVITSKRVFTSLRILHI
jgi:hypothetical protein